MQEKTEDNEEANKKIDDPNIKTISICVTGYRNFVPVYKSSSISISASFLNEELGPTQSHALIYREYTPIDMHFSLNYNQALLSDLDKLITLPVVFTVTEIEVPESVEIQMPQVDTAKEEVPGEIDYEDDLDEIALRQTLQLQEAYTGVVTNREDLMPIKEIKKMKKQNKAHLKKIMNKKGSSSIKSDVDPSKEEIKSIGPILIGTTSLDLLPFFLGKKEIIETIPLKKRHIFSIEDCKSILNTPYIEIKATVEELVTKIEDSNILNLTIEAFYNFPSIMGPEMDYSIAVHIPITEMDEQPLIFKKFEFCTTRNIVTYKSWYTKPHLVIDLPTSKYVVEPSVSGIKNRAGADLLSLVGKKVPRIEYNVVKRTFMKDEVLEIFQKRLQKYRAILFEIYVTAKTDKQVESVKGQAKSDKSKTKDKSKDRKEQPSGDSTKFLHLMAFAELNSLLHPGVQKCRIACPIHTYHEEEIAKKIGEYNSVFIPKQPQVVQSASSSPFSKRKKDKAESKKSKKEKSEGKKSKKDKSESKKSKKDKSTKSKMSNKSSTDKNNVVDKLPPAPVTVVIEPSKIVYDESGNPTFLLVEFELMNPLIPVRTIEDLSHTFYKLIPEYPKYGKQITSFAYSESFFRETVRQLIESINKQYKSFIEEIEESECQCEQNELSFLSYLHHEGVYKTYFVTIQKAISVVISSKYPELTNASEHSLEYQNTVSDIYTYLMNDMNKIVNMMSLCDLDRPPVLPIDEIVCRLQYAKEACELGAYELAKKYHLLRLESCDTNPDYWFDYAVYYVEIQQLDKAKECLKEALALKSIHTNSLILFGTLLLEERKFFEAETFYLLISLHEPRLVEGWSLLYLLYQQQENLSGQELCMEMIDKYIVEEDTYENYFFKTDDLAWSTKILPRTPFFKLASLLIKMRMLHTANLAIAHEVSDNEKFCHYLIGASLYYNGSYKNAYYHIAQAIKLYGFDNNLGGMLGHCLLQMKNYSKAIEVYQRVLQSNDRPDDIHLIYIRAAIANDRDGKDQLARKLLLLACKYCPTPYTWLGAGLMYFKENDLFSAEACFCQANALDNLLPEIWAYLCLINLKLNRQCEAQMCYKQAIRNELNDPDLLKEVNTKMNQSKSKIKFNTDVQGNLI